MTALEPVALTALAAGAGCGCKLPAAELLPIVRDLPLQEDPRLLVGAATSDDAAVVRVREDLALVQTIDFFTPLVDDPYDFGQIAAANALSDVYAMGGTPLSALNVVAFPLERLGGDVLAAVLRGGLDVVASAGAVMAGGHSIDDAEPKYGLAVTGIVDPGRMLTNAGGRVGDALVLTKALGVGAVVTRAQARGAGRRAAGRRGRDDDGLERRGLARGPGRGRACRDRRDRLRLARSPPPPVPRERGGGGAGRCGGARDWMASRSCSAAMRLWASPAARVATRRGRKASRSSRTACRRGADVC